MVAKAQEPGIRVGMDKFAPAFSGMTAEEQPNWGHPSLRHCFTSCPNVHQVPTSLHFFPFAACSFLTAVCFLLLSLSFLPPLSPIVITTWLEGIRAMSYEAIVADSRRRVKCKEPHGR